MLRKTIYLDNASTSRFHPHECIKNVNYAVYHSANPTRSAHDSAIFAGLKVYETRTKLLNYFSAKSSYCVFTKNCTEAINLALLGSIPENSHIVTTVMEHNSTLRTLNFLTKTRGVSVTTVPLSKEGYLPTYRIENAIRSNTFMVCVNHVSNVNGVKANLEEIGKITARKNIRFFVDGAQSSGHACIDVDKFNIDALACPAHKGLLGLQGLGFLIFSERLKPNPIIYGGTGTNSESISHPKDAPDAYEAGTLSFPLIYGLNGSIDFLKKEGKNISNSISKLTNELIYGLKNIKKVKIYTPSDALNGVVGFNVGAIPSTEVSDILNQKYSIEVRSGLHCAPLMHNALGTLDQGIVRASIGACNTQKDIEKMLVAVEKIARKC